MSRRRIAVVGAGISGLTAAYLLREEADVTVYEADQRLGGHAHTHDLTDSSGASQRVDTGFIVHNERTYPNLLRIFGELGVKTQDSEMSMSISCRECGLEYAGALGFKGLFPTGRNAARGRYLRLLIDIPRFHRQARKVLQAGDDAPLETLDAFLDRGHFSRYFRTHFVAPLISCVWSCGPDVAGQYPARYLFEFLRNHGMLSIKGSPTWRTVSGGSHRYVEAIAATLGEITLGTPVEAVRRVGDGVEIVAGGQTRSFDAVVIATHPDQALAMLASATEAEKSVLGAIHYSTNPTVLHSDTTVLPNAERAGASWNYRMHTCSATASIVEVSYDMNRLQRLESSTRYLVTLNDPGTIDPDQVIDTMIYHHPIFTPESVAAQRRLPEINDGVIAFAGAYHGWGFHEDGCRSGVAAARSLGATWGAHE